MTNFRAQVENLYNKIKDETVEEKNKAVDSIKKDFHKLQEYYNSLSEKSKEEVSKDYDAVKKALHNIQHTSTDKSKEYYHELTANLLKLKIKIRDWINN